MHYGDSKQVERSRLTLVIYKHDILGSTHRRNKDGRVSRRCVSYEVTSIQNCKFFNPRSLKLILSDPYEHLSKMLDHLPTEEWFKVTFRDIDGWGKFEVESIENVSEHSNKMYRLH